jgi:hypothetical protein
VIRTLEDRDEGLRLFGVADGEIVEVGEVLPRQATETPVLDLVRLGVVLLPGSILIFHLVTGH